MLDFDKGMKRNIKGKVTEQVTLVYVALSLSVLSCFVFRNEDIEAG